METRNSILAITIVLLSSTFVFAQKAKNDLDRGYSFDGRNFVVSLNTGFFGNSYGYGKASGAPVLLSLEYGLHRYVGISLYGGMLHRKPVWGENAYKLDVYTGGGRINFHLYHLIDDLVKINLRGDIIDVYGNLAVGFDHYDTNLPVRTKYSYYITGGAGVRVYPIKKVQGLGFNMEFSTILSPWLLGLNYKF
jgi:hypothetical protein